MPGDGSIVAANLATGAVTARWPTHGTGSTSRWRSSRAHASRWHSAFRRVMLIDPAFGAVRQLLGPWRFDDLFFDRSDDALSICDRARSSLSRRAAGLVPTAPVASRARAHRLFVPEEDRLYVAAARVADPAAILVYRPAD